ncbi:uncharacterized protein LOC124261951 [Haliotis rubra]|uniref:uncharacterized protein LOC124261951 n=1 Tax=Haliotis rubra TaxID=36100 RepID=UPI001EE5913E|nr:uncharacterized protein LOC124261951 [Haliotis rubra]
MLSANHKLIVILQDFFSVYVHLYHEALFIWIYISLTNLSLGVHNHYHDFCPTNLFLMLHVYVVCMVVDLIQGHRKAWIGLSQRRINSGFKWDDSAKFQYNFGNFRSHGRHSKQCAVIRSDGYWVSSYCSIDNPYVCSKKPDCEPGWSGDECDRQCHCYAGFVCNASATCRYGCEPGWYGEMCDTHQEKTTVSFYCMKQREGAYSLMLSSSHPTDQLVGIVNAEGAINPNCSIERPERILKPSEMRLNVQIKNVSGELIPNCPAEIVADGVLNWTIRFQKEKGVESFEDEEHQVQCDLSKADAAFDAKGVAVEKIRERPIMTATQTRVNVRAYLASPETLEPVANISLGVPVRLVVTLPEGDDVVNPFFYPRFCQASSPDGKVSFPLTGSYGCPPNRNKIGFGRMTKVSGVIQSNVFPLFRLWGYTEVVFSCTLVVPRFNRFEYYTPNCSW